MQGAQTQRQSIELGGAIEVELRGALLSGAPCVIEGARVIAGRVPVSGQLLVRAPVLHQRQGQTSVMLLAPVGAGKSGNDLPDPIVVGLDAVQVAVLVENTVNESITIIFPTNISKNQQQKMVS